MFHKLKKWYTRNEHDIQRGNMSIDFFHWLRSTWIFLLINFLVYIKIWLDLARSWSCLLSIYFFFKKASYYINEFAFMRPFHTNQSKDRTITRASMTLSLLTHEWPNNKRANLMSTYPPLQINICPWPSSRMMTSLNGNIFRVIGALCGEFTSHRWIPSHRPVTWSFDVFFNRRLKKRLDKHSSSRWFETPSRSIWRHCYGRP